MTPPTPAPDRRRPAPPRRRVLGHEGDLRGRALAAGEPPSLPGRSIGIRMGREGSGAVRHRLVMWLVVLLLAASPARAGDSAVGAMPELGAFLSAAADREDAARYLEREARRAFPDDPRLR